MSDEEKRVPSKFLPRSQNFSDVIQQRLGTSDYDLNFDNEFQEFKLIMKFKDEVEEAIKQEVIPLKKKDKLDLYPDKTALDRIDKIWNGRCWYAKIYNEEQTKIVQSVFCYNEPVGDVKIIPIPKLKNMVPVRQIKEDTWGIQVREPWALAYAWEGASYATIVNDANFSYHLMEGSIPKIKQEDMYSLSKRTSIYHRPVYFALMDDLTYFFRKNSNVFLINMQKINKWMIEVEQLSLFETLNLEQVEAKVVEATDDISQN